MPRKRKSDHVVLINDGGPKHGHCHCKHCGDYWGPIMPCSLRMANAVCKAFLKDHEGCPKSKEKANATPECEPAVQRSCGNCKWDCQAFRMSVDGSLQQCGFCCDWEAKDAEA